STRMERKSPIPDGSSKQSFRSSIGRLTGSPIRRSCRPEVDWSWFLNRARTGKLLHAVSSGGKLRNLDGKEHFVEWFKIGPLSGQERQAQSHLAGTPGRVGLAKLGVEHGLTPGGLGQLWIRLLRTAQRLGGLAKKCRSTR